VLVKLAEPLPVTFHRAFDSCPNLANALQAVIDTGATRLLTSGGKPRATEGLSNLADLVEQAGERIVIMPGGSIRAGNVQRILRETDAREIHSALTTAHESANAKPGVPRNGADASAGLEQVGFEPVGFESVEFEPRVREMRDLIATLNPNPLDDEALPG
jgi:copper homeostasis protein CutC